MISEPRELARPSNHILARRAKNHGMQNALRIIVEAKLAGVAVSLAFAVAEQETAFARNVWGGDPAPNGGTAGLNNQVVTKQRYLIYRSRRGSRGQGGMQGVGPFQLTWYEFQDEADAWGGCWKPKYNTRVALRRLAGLIRMYGVHDGISHYNGVGSAAERYAESVMGKQVKWHKRLSS